MDVQLPFTYRASGGGYAVRDRMNRVVAYVYGRQNSETARVANVLTLLEAEKMAKAICMAHARADGTLGLCESKPIIEFRSHSRG